MDNTIISPATKAGTAGGTLLVVILDIFSATDIMHTVVVSGVGAAVSFLVSMGLKMVVRRFRKKKEA
jgi:hypothetical protein